MSGLRLLYPWQPKKMPFKVMTQAAFVLQQQRHCLPLLPTCRHLLTFTCMTQALVGERFLQACRYRDF